MMPRVLILPSWYGLDEGDLQGVLFEEQARALAERGAKVGIVYPHMFKLTEWRAWLAARRASGAARQSGAEPERMEGTGRVRSAVPVLRSVGMSWFPMFPRLNRWILVRRGMHLFRKYVDAHGMPDVVHVQAMYRAGAVALAVKRRYGVPYVITEHHSMYALRGLRRVDVRHYARVAAGAAARMAVSPALCRQLESVLGGAGGWGGSASAAAWMPIPNSVSERFLKHPLEEGGGGFEFLCVSHLQEKKGVDVLIRAFARAFGGRVEGADSAEEADRAEEEKTMLTIAGDGPLRGRLEGLAAELGVAERIRFVGRISREGVVRAMAACQAYVLPSTYETFGMVVVEALAMGRPVVATACGGPEWIVGPGEGVLVPVGDVEAMAGALVAMRRGAAMFDAHALRAGCRARFSDDVVAARLFSIYREVTR